MGLREDLQAAELTFLLHECFDQMFEDLVQKRPLEETGAYDAAYAFAGFARECEDERISRGFQTLVAAWWTAHDWMLGLDDRGRRGRPRLH